MKMLSATIICVFLGGRSLCQPDYIPLSLVYWFAYMLVQGHVYNRTYSATTRRIKEVSHITISTMSLSTCVQISFHVLR